MRSYFVNLLTDGGIGPELWYRNGKYHREDGPAVIYANGNIEYWINGVQLTPVQFKIRTSKPEDISTADVLDVL